jgi:hypothetical protein
MLPDPTDQPTMRLWPDVGEILGLSRASTYEAAKRGEIPTIRFGARVVVPTAALRRLVQLDPEREERSPCEESVLDQHTTTNHDRGRPRHGIG